MKKVVLGGLMVLAGLLSAAVLLGGSMANDWTLNGGHSALWNLSRYGLTPALWAFLAVAAMGLALALWGLFDQKD